MLDFRIQTFLTVCRTLNYTRAAEALSITQPAVSQHISHLEREYAAKLFEYKNRKLSLTPAGKVLYETACGMEHEERLAREAIAGIGSKKERYSIGVTLTAGEYILARPLVAWLEEHPGVEVRIVQGSTEQLIEKLRAGSIDFALIEGYFDKKDFDWQVLRSEALTAVCPPKSRWAGRAGATYQDLLGERLIVREEGSGTRAVLEHALGQSNLTTDDFAQRTEITSLNIIKEFVAAGYGIAFLYEAAVRADLENGVLARIEMEETPAVHDITFICLKGGVSRNRIREIFDEIAERSARLEDEDCAKRAEESS